MWISDIESMILTRVKIGVKQKLETKYPNIFFTTSDRNQVNPRFPTVMIRDMGGAERGNDNENIHINAYLCTIQVDVIDNESQNRAKDVMRYVIDEMKKMSFSIITAPISDNNSDTYRVVARCRREIGWNDIL